MVIAVAVGIGGGLLIAEMMSPKTPVMETAKLERRTERNCKTASPDTAATLSPCSIQYIF